MNKCKQQVMHGYHMVQCQRNEVTDGFCRQHHPDSVAERDRVRKIAWETKQANSIYARYASLKDRIAELESQLAEKPQALIDIGADDINEHLIKRAERAEAQLADQKPYLKHKASCVMQSVISADQIRCTCGLQAILEKGDE